ncbi:hypothetical protein Tco_1044394 [Tanacetum coccineum]|uniref:Uncharacterized protein n=1 Tax=Tanacetum coccineum TaxID=301880 RepID=A0ABQ5GQV4_9ASTR
MNSNDIKQIGYDLFTYEVEIADIPCDLNGDDDSEQQMSHEANDDMGYDPFDVEFTECGCSEWPTCSWREDGYCNGGNKPAAYIVGNTLRLPAILKDTTQYGVSAPYLKAYWMSRVVSPSFLSLLKHYYQELAAKKSTKLVKYLQSGNLEVLES